MTSDAPAHLLFTYGTLQDAAVQMRLFGRTIDGAPDRLPGFRIDRLTIADPAEAFVAGMLSYPILRRGDAPDAVVAGMVYALTDAEIAAADAYEGADYVRIACGLESGRTAFVYVAPD